MLISMLPVSSTRQEEIMKEMIAIMEVTTGPLSVIHGKLLLRPENTYHDSYRLHMERMLKKIREKICLSTAINGDLNRHRAHVCIVCDYLSIGLEEVKFIDKLVLLCH